MEDIMAEWDTPNLHGQALLVSIKGHKAGSASNPNLVSRQKAKALYAKYPASSHFLVLILHYLPDNIDKDGFQMHIQEVGLFHLKDLEEHHFSLQTIRAGGQFLLRGIDNIQDSYRTPQAFYAIVCRKETVWLETKTNK